MPAPVHKPLQVIAAEDSRASPARRTPVVHEIGLEAVGEEHEGPIAQLALHAVGVEPGLLLALQWVVHCALGLDNRKWSAASAEEHVVHVANPGATGHAVDLYLSAYRVS